MGRRIIACVAALALSIGIALGTLSAQAATGCTPQASWGTPDGGLAAEVVSLINQHRVGMGLSALDGSQALSDSANWKSMNMAGLGYFDHYDPPNGRSPVARAASCGYSGNFGENIYWASSRATAQSVVSGWLGSSGHRANIENGSYTVTGVGVAVDANGGTYWTQEFGTGGGSGVTTPPPPAPGPVAPPPPPTAPRLSPPLR